ncbi:UDP-N-acetylmuramoyl-tripeptide--D-alanyl-D-alanine ligase [Zhouia sp. PK063]|uniref:UDP-N-acetylmuramoyl-tripeptide--D-alanyl-D- alanine ligase n=1 Tax=Zhouia sp. PK063 TaxID=3373602 RepID=UPI0037927012
MNIEALHRIFLATKKISTDTRNIEPNSIFFALKGEHFNANSFTSEAIAKGAALVIIDEDAYEIPEKTFLVDDVLTTLQELANYHRNYLKLPIISLTGSNGKTTTKELINAVLLQKFKTVATKGNLNNHIGVPLTLLSMQKDTELGIVEMGANHQKEIEALCKIAQPDYGYITNFGKAHLEGFGGVEGVIKGKSELYDFLISHNKTIFINEDDAIQLKKTTAYPNTFSFGEYSEKLKIKFLAADPMVTVQVDGLTIKSHLIGKYNFYNIAAAIAIGYYFEVDPSKIKKAIEHYIPSNNRSQILEKGDKTIILDAYNANPTSMKAALDNFAQLSNLNKIAFIGDMLELGNEAEKEHQYIVDYISELGLTNIFLIGKNFYKTKASFPKYIDFTALKENVNFSTFSNAIILIKGSRGIALERITELL